MNKSPGLGYATGNGGAVGGKGIDAFNEWEKNGAYGSVPEDEAALLEALKREAAALISGQGVPDAETLYRPVERSINTQAFNAAGSDAATLARRGLSRSGMQRGSFKAIEVGKADALSQARTQADAKAEAYRQQAQSLGDSMLEEGLDMEQRRKMLSLAQSQRFDWMKDYEAGIGGSGISGTSSIK